MAEKSAEKLQYLDKIAGSNAPIFWATILFNVILPQLMWRKSFRLNEGLVSLVSLGAIIGMWCERYAIVVMSLRRTALPSAWGNYSPTLWDWLTLFGTVGLFAAGVLISVRLLPMISMFEMRELIARRAQADAGHGE